MKLISCLVFIVCAGTTSVVYGASSNDALQLAKQLYDRPDGKDRASFGYMVLTEAGHKSRVRALYSYGKDKSYYDIWSLIRFTSPKDIEGTGLLTRDEKSADSQQWVFLPALKRVRKIASSRKGGRFVGSDLFYEDLQNRIYTKDQHKILGEEVINKLPTTILESIPKNARDSVYSKRLSWIHRPSLTALRIDYYQGGSQPIKRLTVNKLAKKQGYWTVMESVVKDLKTGHSTVMRIKHIAYDQNLPDSLFTTQTLEDPAKEVAYRPSSITKK
ncbi:outer membrane lipoprotein-sorting protein [Zooshikella marina]|uniref:Outer membrane lipoprotein-sorting protein n=1 Tax=Zooshikella ganghwensis TaxID=202772 RepID=A0A4P9VR86_9GAMM|nr:outer membrane lipoprotein-sorting protein [Zooshikella ganghwensis]MBU2704450.1 outer membrane lipoprotein-sorting protein [Zooshikella ganghwensis]RDH44914.1 outer membrane lipoprotein-sorting protein [Zooshikella ganghwensis]